MKKGESRPRYARLERWRQVAESANSFDKMMCADRQKRMRNDPKICSVVWNLIRGGTEGQCARVAMGLAAAGTDHRVAVFRREGYFLDAVEAACGPVFPFEVHRFRGKETRAAVSEFARWLQAEGIEGVHSWEMDANIFAGRAARQAGIPYITSRRDMGEIYPWYKLWFQRQSERSARRVVVNAKAIGDWAAIDRVPADKVVQLPNIVPVEELDAGQRESGTTISRCGVVQWVHVARLDPEKDVALLIRAVARLREEQHEVGLWVDSTRSRPRRPRAFRSASSEEPTPRNADTNAASSPTGTTSPHPLPSTSSRFPPQSVATTGRPTAMYSRIVLLCPSFARGTNTPASACARMCGTSCRSPKKWTASPRCNS